MNDSEKATITAQINKLDDDKLRWRTNGLRDLIEAGKVPDDKIEAAREMLAMAWAERQRRGV